MQFPVHLLAHNARKFETLFFPTPWCLTHCHGNVSSPLTSPGWQMNKTGEKILMSGVVEERVKNRRRLASIQARCIVVLRSVSFVIQVIARTGITMRGRFFFNQCQVPVFHPFLRVIGTWSRSYSQGST